MKKIQNSAFGLLLFGVVLMAAMVPRAQADEGQLAVSYSTEHLDGLRAGYRWTDGPKILPQRWFDLIGSPRVHWEAAVNTWVNSRNSHDRINAITFSPVLQWSLTGGSQPLLLEAG